MSYTLRHLIFLKVQIKSEGIAEGEFMTESEGAEFVWQMDIVLKKCVITTSS